MWSYTNQMASADFEVESQVISYFKCKEQSNQIQTYLSIEENDKLIISYNSSFFLIWWYIFLWFTQLCEDGVLYVI